jgi:2-polyprenyl-3-methyl-5-hydroxy-6-metoxy-1,4-benzoquinol methylase
VTHDDSGGPASAPVPSASNHYSYAVYADPATAECFDRRRFSGPIGTLIADTQERLLVSSLPGIEGQAVLDVGTGTGRAALALARRGARVVGLDASEQMLAVARSRAGAEGVGVEFVVGDAHRLAYGDRAFDAAISLRVLMHTPDWRRCLGELCRVTRGRVVFDYPAWFSGAALQALGRRVAARLGSRTEAYRVLRDASVAAELARHGFRVVERHRQFVLPIALHKAIGSRPFTLAAERMLARAGLLRLLGSPVTVVAVRDRDGAR